VAISDGNNKLTSLALIVAPERRAHRANKECRKRTNKKTHREALAPSAGEAAPLAAALLVSLALSAHQYYYMRADSHAANINRSRVLIYASRRGLRLDF